MCNMIGRKRFTYVHVPINLGSRPHGTNGANGTLPEQAACRVQYTRYCCDFLACVKTRSPICYMVVGTSSHATPRGGWSNVAGCVKDGAACATGLSLKHQLGCLRQPKDSSPVRRHFRAHQRERAEEALVLGHESLCHPWSTATRGMGTRIHL